MKRINHQVRQRRRQTWLDIPASGIEEVGHSQEQCRSLSEITVSENVSRKLELAYNREALRICHDE